MSNATTGAKVTPMMAQWHACKKLAENAILLFRMGDFYEAFYDDAETLARELGLTLTKRQDIPMSGVPVHTCEQYIDKLVAKGFRVAVAEQMEDPKKTKGLVRREIVRVVTPGSLVSSNLLTDKANNFFVTLHEVAGTYGLAWIDLSTGEFQCIEFTQERALLNEVARLRPSEFLVSGKFEEKHLDFFAELKAQYQFLVNTQEAWHFDLQSCTGTLTDHFHVHSLDGFGLKGLDVAATAAGALIAYLRDELSQSVGHVRSLRTYSTKNFLALDRSTQRNLELTESLIDGGRNNTLLQVLDYTQTPMGGRLLHHWIKQPLMDVTAIGQRQDAIEELLEKRISFETLKEQLGSIRDLERLVSKISAGYAHARDLVTLRFSLEPIAPLLDTLHDFGAELLRELSGDVDPLDDVARHITEALVDEPPLRLGEGATFREGFHPPLDELRALSADSKAFLADYQARVREETGIKTLRVGYTRVFGYYIEVSKAQADKMPDQFQRRQTLTNNERFISPELKEYEEKILSAEDKIQQIESSLFAKLREDIAQHLDRVLQTARGLANIDCLQSLAEAAGRYDYTRPEVTDSDQMQITEGRHPVIEAAQLGERFVPNDTQLNCDKESLLVITGPNMAGKSTYIRQVALLSIMAQMGSFIPAKAAQIGVVDKVFTRIGASDDLSRGQSTFMVEMTETSNILHNATERSLVILDEIGRGTSTYDGISIAWAVAEYLLTARKAKTLFATHYWELTQLEGKLPGAANYHVAVQECEDRIVFLRKIVKGDTDKSYGIHVARLAGLPEQVVERAKTVLQKLEGSGDERVVMGTRAKRSDAEVQFLLFEPTPRDSKQKASAPPPPPPALEELKALDLNALTPLDAINELARLKKLC